ncbi:hypothetical protein H0E87_020803 [Populus deltoides]|uniref:Uncharacterized protein n=1 Tax=Populus deltoides TaxID=3696 RepID=A0A8T2XMX5_POPDE|nr:hypothetical protein H0E87_020803 [Populus deltoides]
MNGRTFGRGSRSSSIRYQSGGGCCTTNKKRLRSSKLETAVKRQAPPIKEKYSPLKAGTEKAQGSGSGASKQSPKFKTYRRRREKDHQSPKRALVSSSTSAALSCSPPISPKRTAPTRPKPRFVSRITHTAAAALIYTIQEKILFSIFYLLNLPGAKRRICKKMGESHHQAATSSRLGISNTVGEIVEVQGGLIVRPTGRKRPPQQGLYSQKAPETAASGSQPTLLSSSTMCRTASATIVPAKLSIGSSRKPRPP